MDVVAHEDEQITRQRERAVEHPVLMRVETGAEKDVFERLGVISACGQQSEGRNSGKKAAAGSDHGLERLASISDCA